MELKIDGTKEELEQIAIMGYLANFILNGSKEDTALKNYPKLEVFNNTLRKVHKAILELIPDTEILEVDRYN